MQTGAGTVGSSEREPTFDDVRRSSDRNARNQLVERHLPLAEHLAHRFAHRGEPLDDLVQVASLALVKAVERFDPGRGVQFTTFAVPTILGELKRHFRDKTWAVRVPRRLQEVHLRIGSAVDQLRHELGRSPTIPEIAVRLDVSVEDVAEGIDAGVVYRSTSLESLSSERPIGELLGDTDPRLDEAAIRQDIRELLATLPRRDRSVVILRFYGGLTQCEIADRIGVSQMQVSRILARTLAVLHDRAGENRALAS